MESSKVFESETSDCDNHADAVYVFEGKQSEEREHTVNSQTPQQISASIKNVKRTCTDGDAKNSEDDSAVIIPAKTKAIWKEQILEALQA